MMLILASGSPRRRELLRKAGIAFDVVESGVEERVPPGCSVRQVVETLALQKAEAVSRQFPEALVLGADTAIELDGGILGKPEDEADAIRMLGRLRGRGHRVKTGLALCRQHPSLRLNTSVSSRVEMRRYSQAEINAYVKTGEPLDKAGAYAIQERGGALVRAVRGCYNNIVGLPLCELAALLRQAGYPEAARLACHDCPRT